MTDTQVSKRMQRLGTEQLKGILTTESKDYTPEALTAARQELESRGEAEEVSVATAAKPDARALPPAVNGIGMVVRLVGYALLALGLILGVLLYGKTKLSLNLALAGGVMAAGVLFLGVSEAIKLLMALKDS